MLIRGIEICENAQICIFAGRTFNGEYDYVLGLDSNISFSSLFFE